MRGEAATPRCSRPSPPLFDCCQPPAFADDTECPSTECRIQWLEGSWDTDEVSPGGDGRAWKGSLVQVVRSHMPASGRLRLRQHERENLFMASRTQHTWRYPRGQLQAVELRRLHDAVRRARWDVVLTSTVPTLARGDWCTDDAEDGRSLPTTIMRVEDVGSLRTCTLSCWKQRGAAFQPAGRLVNRTVSRLWRIDAVDCSTSEIAGDGCHGRHLRVLGHGGCALHGTYDFQWHTVRDGRAALQGGQCGIVAPMATTAAALQLAVEGSTRRHLFLLEQATGQTLP
eukprot:COSAG02_NODE_259_length_26776_cov_1723.750084_23_plen_285_part_00